MNFTAGNKERPGEGRKGRGRKPVKDEATESKASRTGLASTLSAFPVGRTHSGNCTDSSFC